LDQALRYFQHKEKPQFFKIFFQAERNLKPTQHPYRFFLDKENAKNIMQLINKQISFELEKASMEKNGFSSLC